MVKRIVTSLLLLAMLVSGIAIERYALSPSDSNTSADDWEEPEFWATVEKRVIEEKLILRGFVQSERQTSLTAPVDGVVTSDSAAQSYGDVVVELSGSPVLLLHGPIPAYRDLSVGDSGPDVEQLNEALRTLGFGTGGEIYDDSTATAIRDLYQRNGYQNPPLETGDVEVALPYNGQQLVMASVLYTDEEDPLIEMSVEVGDVVTQGMPVGEILGGDLQVVFSPTDSQAAALQTPLDIVLSFDDREEPSVLNESSVDGETVFSASVAGNMTTGTEALGTVTFTSSVEAVMAVPLPAVSNGSSGTSVVIRSTEFGFEEIPVDLGVTARGWVEIQPGKLNVGDRVRIS